MADLIIGSGPSGVAAASARLALGRDVVMIDVGETLEPEHEGLRARLAEAAPDQWPEADLARFRTAPEDLPAGALRRYRSNFFVRDQSRLFEPYPDWLGLQFSFARGGLSNAWGAAVLPYRQEDLGGWPVTAAELAPHYKAVAALMPIAGEADDLQALFPAQDVSALRPLAGDRQGETLLRRLRSQGERLRAEGVYVGRARQAVSTDCRRCGLCLHGCPYQLIFKASQLLDRLRANPRFDYRPARRALAFAEDEQGVRVSCRRDDGSREEIAGDRLFVAAGVLPSAQLALASIAPDQAVTLLDSQQLFLPMLHLWPGGDPGREPRHTLTQVFVEMLDPQVSPWTVHAQFYGYNEFYAPDMRSRYGRGGLVPNALFEAVSRRLIVAQLFLHSDHSHRIGLRLAADRERLEARLEPNPAVGPTALRARRKLAGAVRGAGLVPLGWASRLDPPGSSFHCGGTFPMRARPQGLEADVLGRPAGLGRVHLVDASVFPSVPTTTITLSVMANAHRIAAMAPTG